MYFASTAVKDVLHQPIFQIVLTIGVAIILQIIGRSMIGFVIRRAVKTKRNMSDSEKNKRAKTLDRVFENLFLVILWIIALVTVLTELKINLTALLTGAGLIGVIAGLALQNVIKDYIAGVFIIIENQYQVGDVVTLGNIGSPIVTSGVVEDITIRTTQLRDVDGTMHIVTNGTATVISNMSFHYSVSVIDMNVSIGSDIDLVENIINDVGKDMQADDKWGDLIIKPIKFLRIDSFSDTSFAVKASGKVKPGEQWSVAGEFRRRIKKAFAENGIEPFKSNVKQA